MKIERTMTRTEAVRNPIGRPNASDTLKWNGKAVERFYSAYFVRVETRADSILTFHFLRFDDGSDVPGGPHTLDLSDVKYVWRDEPSAVDGAAPGTTDCGFLFLNRVEINADPNIPASLKTAMATSGGGTGKFPRSAGVERAFQKLREVAESIQRDLQGQPPTPLGPRNLLKEVKRLLDQEDEREARLERLVRRIGTSLAGLSSLAPDTRRLLDELRAISAEEDR